MINVGICNTSLVTKGIKHFILFYFNYYYKDTRYKMYSARYQYYRVLYFFFGRSPKILVPTLTLLLPSLIACTKSALIPILNSSSSSLGAPGTPFSAKTFASSARVRLRHSKSGLGFVGSWEASQEPIVMMPNNLSPGHFSITCTARSTSSVELAVAPGRGDKPDLESSPEVLTWR